MDLIKAVTVQADSCCNLDPLTNNLQKLSVTRSIDASICSESYKKLQS